MHLQVHILLACLAQLARASDFYATDVAITIWRLRVRPSRWATSFWVFYSRQPVVLTVMLKQCPNGLYTLWLLAVWHIMHRYRPTSNMTSSPPEVQVQIHLGASGQPVLPKASITIAYMLAARMMKKMRLQNIDLIRNRSYILFIPSMQRRKALL